MRKSRSGRDGGEHAALGVGQHEFGAVGAQRALALDAHGGGQAEGQAVAAHRGGHENLSARAPRTVDEIERLMKH